jgi:hypothetical protein
MRRTRERAELSRRYGELQRERKTLQERLESPAQGRH